MNDKGRIISDPAFVEEKVGVVPFYSQRTLEVPTEDRSRSHESHDTD